MPFETREADGGNRSLHPGDRSGTQKRKCLGKAGQYTASAGYPEQAAEAFRKAIDLSPNAAGFHMGYGHVLKTLGDQPASLRTYREAIRLRPDFGEVYWSMANLKIFTFEDAEVEAMEDQLENTELRK